jgi:hypothetical protein
MDCRLKAPALAIPRDVDLLHLDPRRLFKQ